MSKESYSILLIEDDQDDAVLIKESLRLSKYKQFSIHHVELIKDAILAMETTLYDLILLDLFLPDSVDLKSLSKIRSKSSNTPIIILTSLQDESIAICSVKAGAQDYLIKDFTDPDMLIRAVHLGMERHKHWTELQKLILKDELTGLYNRKGFWTLGEQLLKIIRRSKESGYVLYFDLDNMKKINDQFGHAAGDQALIQTAKVLTKTFRETDVIARLGGDEFAVAAVVSSLNDEEKILSRFQLNLDASNQDSCQDFSLQISTGIVPVDIQNYESVEEVLSKADQLMYLNKQNKMKN